MYLVSKWILHNRNEEVLRKKRKNDATVRFTMFKKNKLKTVRCNISVRTDYTQRPTNITENSKYKKMAYLKKQNTRRYEILHCTNTPAFLHRDSKCFQSQCL